MKSNALMMLFLLQVTIAKPTTSNTTGEAVPLQKEEVNLSDWILPPSRSESFFGNDSSSASGPATEATTEEVVNAFLKLPEVLGHEFANASLFIKDRLQNVSISLKEKLENLHSKLTTTDITSGAGLVSENAEKLPVDTPGFFDSFQMVSVYLHGLSEAFSEVVKTARDIKFQVEKREDEDEKEGKLRLKEIKHTE